MSEPTDAAAELMTLDDLTRRVGMSVRNVRFYTTKGLVPPPIRRGRSGYYTADHLARLELVRELQAHGFTLSAIERYVARIPDDATPETIALHRTLLAPWMAEMPETIGKRELVRRAGRPLSQDDLEALNALGIVFPTKQGKYEVAVAHLSVGVALLDLGLPLEAALAAQDIFTEHGRRIAEELTELFRTKVWPVYRDGRAGPEQLREVVFPGAGAGIRGGSPRVFPRKGGAGPPRGGAGPGAAAGGRRGFKAGDDPGAGHGVRARRQRAQAQHRGPPRPLTAAASTAVR